MKTVLIVDDDEGMRDTLTAILKRDYRVLRVASGEAALPLLNKEDVDLLILDVRLPGISGLDFQSRRDEFGVHLPIVLMTGHGDVPMSVRAMKGGAVDFLSKPFRDQDVIDAVMAAIELDRERRAAESATAGIRDRYASLSPREQQVMTLVTAGKISKQVAFDLGLSEITVKTYRCAMMQKMGARTFADLVRMADALALRGAS